jgi:hypothetical protein
MRQGKTVNIAKNDKQEKYIGQYIAAVEVWGYICAVPYVETGSKAIFLKTAYPDRVLNKKFNYK